MKFLITVIIILSTVQSYPQGITLHDSDDYQPAKSELYFRDIQITFKDNTILKSKILGIKDDTLVVSVNKLIQNVPFSAINKISIDDKNISGWMIGGIYLGQLVGFSGIGKENNFYMAEPDILTPYRVLFNFAALGIVMGAGGIVHLIEGDKSFCFTGSNKEVREENERFKEFLLVDNPIRNKFQISFESAFVNTTYSKIKNTLERGEDGISGLYSNFNYLRKIQAVYAISSNLDIGAAYIITSEPSFHWQRYVPDWYPTTDLTGNFSYSGFGVYPVVQYNLTNSFPSLFFDLIAGGGPGIVKINYCISQYESNKYNIQTIDKSIFSGYLFTNIRIRINPTSLLALSADYVLIPEKKLPIDYLKVKAESFSNFSYGISFLFEM